MNVKFQSDKSDHSLCAHMHMHCLSLFLINENLTWGLAWFFRSLKWSCGLTYRLHISPKYTQTQIFLLGKIGLGIGKAWQMSGYWSKIVYTLTQHLFFFFDLPDPVLSSVALSLRQHLLWFSATCVLPTPDCPYTAWSPEPAASSSEAQPAGSIRRERTGPFKKSHRGKKHHLPIKHTF